MNRLYPTGKNGRRYKDKRHPFFGAVTDYWKMNRLAIKGIQIRIEKMIESGCVFEVQRYFCFNYGSLYTKKKTVKRMDVTNRIKAFDDEVISGLIGLDDQYIWKGTEEKIEVVDDGPEFVHVSIRPFEKPATTKDLSGRFTFDLRKK